MGDIGALLAEIDALTDGGRTPAPVAVSEVEAGGPPSTPTPAPAPAEPEALQPSPLEEVRRQVDEVLTVAPDGGPVADAESTEIPGALPAREPVLPADPAPADPAPAVPPESMELPSREPAPAEAPERPGPSALKEIDGAIADDAELLLQGNFDTVSEILDDDTDLDDAEDPYAASPADDAEPDASPPGGESAFLPSREPPADSQFLPSRDPAPVAAEPEAEDGTEPAPPEITTEPVPVVAGTTVWSRLAPVVVTLLCVLNVPLRFVPRSVRPVVDWVALSLVFWVPIVWCVAMVLVRS